ncbi:hypothetical protein GGS26DRAFT_540819 [Hypomontagnella submonticulosa]|nr:hypothetical protein GGS26DRAFT_540819 [Hypomontagnella submonticulosa]
MSSSGRAGPPAPKSAKSGEPPLPWTTARCQRLLRPLVSRIASLRKDTAPRLRDPAKDERKQETGAGTEQQSADDDWLRPRKKARLTYSQRRPSRVQNEQSTPKRGLGRAETTNLRQSEERNGSLTEIPVATPLLKRARGHFVPSLESPVRERVNPIFQGRPGRPHSRPRKREVNEQNNLERRLAELRTLVAPDRYNDLEAVYKSLEALLKATQHGEDNQRPGPRSFLDMCLRAVPRYIEELEAWERMEAEQKGTISTLDDIDTSTQIYDYLESIGPYQGWRHLRVVVRANGVAAVRQGIAEGLFGDDFSIILIDLCAQSGALPEAEELLAVFVDRQYPQPTVLTTKYTPTYLPLFGVLRPFSNKYGRNSFLLRQFSLLLSNGNLPLDWLASPLSEDIWNLATRSLTMNEDADEAAAFMRCSILLLCRRKREITLACEAVRIGADNFTASSQALTSALVMLATMSSLGEMDLSSPHISEAEITNIRLIGNRLRYILRSCVADLESSKPPRSNLGCDLLYLAFFLSSSSARGSDDVRAHIKHSFEQAWRQSLDPKSRRGNGSTRRRLNDMASFISSVARSCSKVLSVASQTCLDTLFGQLEGLEFQEILVSMKAVVAFSLAQRTGRVSDFIYAEKLASSQGQATTDYTSSRSRYRWEGTIGEWVTASPEINRSRSATIYKRSIGVRCVDRRHTYGGFDVVDADTRNGEAVDADVDSSSVSTGDERHGLVTSETEHISTRKRAHSRLRHDKPPGVATLTRSKEDAVLRWKTLAHLAPEDELSSDKENQIHRVRKKPRRSVDKRDMLGPRARPSLTSRTSNALLWSEYSDDELC